MDRDKNLKEVVVDITTNEAVVIKVLLQAFQTKSYEVEVIVEEEVIAEEEATEVVPGFKVVSQVK